MNEHRAILTPAQWRRAGEIFDELLEASVDDRASRLVEACAGDRELESEVRRLLALDSEAGAYLESPLVDLAASSDAPILSAGELVANRFDVVGLLGRGGMGEVYEAYDRELREPVALKIMRPTGVDPRRMAERFRREVQLARRVSHPSVCRVHDVAIHRGPGEATSVVLTMELVRGETVAERLRRGPLPPADVAAIAGQLASALDAAHASEVIHRDIKPGNIILQPLPTGSTRAVLTDFGLATAPRSNDEGATPVSLVFGTPEYLAPEQLRGEPPTKATDRYALALVLYEMVTGVRPHADNLLERASTAPRLPSSLQPDVRSWDAALLQALAPAPEHRFTSASALVQALNGDESKPGAWTRSHSPVQGRARNTPRRLWQPAVLVVAVLALLIGSVVALRPTPAPFLRRDSVAILPFTNVGDNKDAEYLSTGITQDVLAHLGALRDLRIIGGSSVQRYQREKRTPAEIGQALGVATVLEGSVQRAGNRLRVVTRLLDATNGEQLWADDFERDLEDVFSMQTEISRRVAVALRGELSAADTDRLRPPSNKGFDAFNLYLKGRHLAALRTEEGLGQAIALFNESVASDNSFAPAYAGLADAYLSMGNYGLLPRAAAFAKAADAAQSATALDPELPEAHAVLGYVAKNAFDWSAAEKEFAAAIRLRPGYPTAHHWYSILLTQEGRLGEAITEIKAALSLDPLSIGANLHLASVLLMSRRYQDAIGQWERTLQMDPSFVNAYRGIAAAYAYLGLHDKARQAMDEAFRRTLPGSSDQELRADDAYIRALGGDRDGAVRVAREFTSRFELTGESLAGSIAAIYAGLGDTDASLRWVQTAMGLNDPELGFVLVDPRWDPLRSDPRFATILQHFRDYSFRGN